jgi:hypothetical protein
MRFDIAFGKAWSCMAIGHSTRFMEESIAKNRPHFLDSLAATSGGKFVPCMGGVLIREPSGTLIGAIGVTGDSGANDELVAVDAIKRSGGTDKAKVRDAIESTKGYVGSSGNVTMDFLPLSACTTIGLSSVYMFA